MKTEQMKVCRGMIAGVLLLFLLAGCGRTTPTGVTPTIVIPTIEATPTVTVPPASLMLADPYGQASQAVTESLQAFAAANGLAYVVNPDLSAEMDGVKIAVVFADVNIYGSQAASLRETQFLFVSGASEGAGGNISLVSNRPQDMAFMAGYLSTLVAEDWRSGGLLNAASSSAGITGDAFVNGGGYVCGRCMPVYPPYMSYPVFQDVSGKSTAAEIQADVDALAANAVETAFVAASADLPEVLDALELAGITPIGENAASSNVARYAAILGFDVQPALAELLPKLLAGQGGESAFSRVVLVSVNDAEKIPPARRELFAQTAEALAGGWIIPLSVP